MSRNELGLRFALLVVGLSLARLADMAPNGFFKFSGAFTAISLLVVIWMPVNLIATKKPHDD